MPDDFMYNFHSCALAWGWERMLPIKGVKSQWFYAVKRDNSTNIYSFMLHRKIFSQITIIVVIIVTVLCKFIENNTFCKALESLLNIYQTRIFSI